MNTFKINGSTLRTHSSEFLCFHGQKLTDIPYYNALVVWYITMPRRLVYYNALVYV